MLAQNMHLPMIPHTVTPILIIINFRQKDMTRKKQKDKNLKYSPLLGLNLIKLYLICYQYFKIEDK
jgi:hypothetical protein